MSSPASTIDLPSPLKTLHIISQYARSDVYCSCQKPHIERFHLDPRRILQKGVSFNPLDQKQINLVLSHLNSYPRPSLGGRAPYAPEDKEAVVRLKKRTLALLAAAHEQRMSRPDLLRTLHVEANVLQRVLNTLHQSDQIEEETVSRRKSYILLESAA